MTIFRSSLGCLVNFAQTGFQQHGISSVPNFRMAFSWQRHSDAKRLVILANPGHYAPATMFPSRRIVSVPGSKCGESIMMSLN